MLQVKVTDVTDKCCMFSLAGPKAGSLLEGLGAAELADKPLHAHAVFACAGAPVAAASGSGLGSGGATLIADEAVAADLWAKLLAEVRTVGAAMCESLLAPKCQCWQPVAPAQALAVSRSPSTISLLQRPIPEVFALIALQW